MTTEITSIEALPNDVLIVRGRVDGKEIEARGWLSATVNHYDPVDYVEDGHRRGNSQPRIMTPSEAATYCVSLLENRAGKMPPVPLPPHLAKVPLSR